MLGCGSPHLYQSKLRSTWPQKGLIPSCTVGYGVVYLKNDSSIAGQILICPFSNFDHEPDSSTARLPVLPTGKTTKQNIAYIFYKDIARVNIQITGSNDSAEFRPFGGTIANLLGTKNRVKLYYRVGDISTSTDVNNNLTASWGEIMLVDNDTLAALCSTLARSNAWWATYPKFVNKRYNEHLDKYYFRGKDKSFMINYLLDKENERLNRN